MRDAAGARRVATAGRRKVAARSGITGAATTHRATRGLHRGHSSIRPCRRRRATRGSRVATSLAAHPGAGQRVAVIDTGVARHRRLLHLVGGGDYVSTGDGTRDCDAHGTVVAGIIAGTADSSADGFSGVAPEATVISIRQSSAKFAAVTDRSGAAGR
ncbi:subtilase family protein [Mycobacterium kansasii 732]|nr:subtilase family protein [Mycobacterium kansasii 732]